MQRGMRNTGDAWQCHLLTNKLDKYYFEWTTILNEGLQSCHHAQKVTGITVIFVKVIELSL